MDKEKIKKHKIDCAINSSEVADEFSVLGCTCKNKHAQALGRIKTPKKAISSRKNGKKGGRPITRKLDKSAIPTLNLKPLA